MFNIMNVVRRMLDFFICSVHVSGFDLYGDHAGFNYQEKRNFLFETLPASRGIWKEQWLANPVSKKRKVINNLI